MAYPKSDGTKRPYRLWHANERRALQWRYYSDPKRAHVGALIEARWAKRVGVTIEVYNAINGRLLGQYTLQVNGIKISGGS